MPYGPVHSSVSKWVFFDRVSDRPVLDVVVFERRLLFRDGGRGGGGTKYFSIGSLTVCRSEVTGCNVPEADCISESIVICGDFRICSVVSSPPFFRYWNRRKFNDDCRNVAWRKTYILQFWFASPTGDSLTKTYYCPFNWLSWELISEVFKMSGEIRSRGWHSQKLRAS